jgi:DNA-binding MarR family transcriptional regulator
MEKCAYYRRQDFTVIALDVRVERLGSSDQRPRELDAVPNDCGSGSTVDIGGTVAINLTAN